MKSAVFYFNIFERDIVEELEVNPVGVIDSIPSTLVSFKRYP